MLKSHFKKSFILFFAFIFITGCGGGGGSSDDASAGAGDAGAGGGSATPNYLLFSEDFSYSVGSPTAVETLNSHWLNLDPTNYTTLHASGGKGLMPPAALGKNPMMVLDGLAIDGVTNLKIRSSGYYEFELTGITPAGESSFITCFYIRFNDQTGTVGTVIYINQPSNDPNGDSNNSDAQTHYSVYVVADDGNMVGNDRPMWAESNILPSQDSMKVGIEYTTSGVKVYIGNIGDTLTTPLATYDFTTTQLNQPFLTQAGMLATLFFSTSPPSTMAMDNIKYYSQKP